LLLWEDKKALRRGGITLRSKKQAHEKVDYLVNKKAEGG
jgi:hypothetical protein